MRANCGWLLVSFIALFSLGAAAEEIPELDLLEFLADWQAVDGELLEPWMFEDSEPTAPSAKIEESNEHR